MADPVAILKDKLTASSYRELAERIGVSATFLWMVVRGKRAPGPKVLKFLGMRKQTVVTYQ